MGMTSPIGQALRPHLRGDIRDYLLRTADVLDIRAHGHEPTGVDVYLSNDTVVAFQLREAARELEWLRRDRAFDQQQLDVLRSGIDLVGKRLAEIRFGCDRADCSAATGSARALALVRSLGTATP